MSNLLFGHLWKYAFMSQQRRSSRSSRSSVDQPSPGHVLTRNTGPLITTNVFIAFSSLGSSSYPKKWVSTLRSSDAEGFILTFNDHMWQNSSEERIFTVSNKLFSILGQRAAAASLSVLSWDSRNKKKPGGEHVIPEAGVWTRPSGFFLSPCPQESAALHKASEIGR